MIIIKKIMKIILLKIKSISNIIIIINRFIYLRNYINIKKKLKNNLI